MNMKTFLVFFMLFQGAAFAQFPISTSSKTVDVNRVSGQFDSFRWNWIGMNDQRVILYLTQDGVPLDASLYSILARVGRNGVVYTDIADSEVSKATDYIQFDVPRTRIPPNGACQLEVWAYVGTTNTARSLAQGTLSITKSLYSDTNSFPFPTNVVDLSTYLTIASAATNYLTIADAANTYQPLTEGTNTLWQILNKNNSASNLSIVGLSEIVLTNGASMTQNGTSSSLQDPSGADAFIWSDTSRLIAGTNGTTDTIDLGTGWILDTDISGTRFLPQQTKATNHFGVQFDIGYVPAITQGMAGVSVLGLSDTDGPAVKFYSYDPAITHKYSVSLDGTGFHSDYDATSGNDIVTYDVLQAYQSQFGNTGTVTSVTVNGINYPPDPDGLVDLGLLGSGGTGSGSVAMNLGGINKTTVQTINTPGVWTNITGLAVSVTPHTNSAQVLLLATVNMGHDGTNYSSPMLRYTRNGTPIGIPSAAGDRSLVSATFGTPDTGPVASSEDANFSQTFSFNYIDSPATDTNTAYAVQIMLLEGTAKINSSYNDTDNVTNARAISSLAAIDLSSGGAGALGALMKTNDFALMTGLTGTNNQVFVADGTGSGHWTNVLFAVTTAVQQGALMKTNDFTAMTGLAGTVGSFFAADGAGGGYWTNIVFGTNGSGGITNLGLWATYPAVAAVTPDSNNGQDLGMAALGWKLLYFNGTNMGAAQVAYWNSLSNGLANAYALADTASRVTSSNTAASMDSVVTAAYIAADRVVTNTIAVSDAAVTSAMTTLILNSNRTTYAAATNNAASRDATVTAAYQAADVATVAAFSTADTIVSNAAIAYANNIYIASTNFTMSQGFIKSVDTNVYAFSASALTTYVLPNSSSIVPFTNEVTDTTASYNPATAAYTVTKAGTWLISYDVNYRLQTTSGGDNCYAAVQLVINGATAKIQRVRRQSDGTGINEGICSSIVIRHCNVGDVIRVFAYRVTSGAASVLGTADSGANTFSGHLIK